MNTATHGCEAGVFLHRKLADKGWIKLLKTSLLGHAVGVCFFAHCVGKLTGGIQISTIAFRSYWRGSG
jgi:hypothetical protein